MLELVIEPRRHALSQGLEVRRILPYRQHRMVGPFIFLDHAGPVDLPPALRRQADVKPHPHIGLATVTYLLDGQLTHRDSLGFAQLIRPHEVNWMTAGRGIAHSERFDVNGTTTTGPLELLQSWCALPVESEESAPSFAHHATDVLPVVEDCGIWMRLIAGHAYGVTSGVRVASPLFYVHAVVQPGAILRLPDGHAERAAYVARGRVEVDGRDYQAGQLLIFAAGGDATITARDTATLMLLGGEPLGERFIWWNFVSSRKDRIEQAKADWRAGRIALPPNDDREFIPLP